MTVAVWAPRARSVELERAGRRVGLSRDDAGWWRCKAALRHGEDYGFVVDGEGPFPDPRSPWQPDGVHGRSRHVDHARFAWSDARWRPPALASALIYELHAGTFSPEGTFDGIAARLGHLKDLGVTHVELMPVAAFPGARGWGYDGVALYAPHQAYGGPDGLKSLVDACHAHGLAVLMDVVYNHLGPDGNYLGRFGPYFTDRYRTPWGEAVNFDGAGSDEVRRFFVDNALMWLRDYHCDGLRVDAVHAMLDRSAVHFLEQLTAEVRELEAALGRKLAVIAESDLNDPRLLWPVARGGYGMDAQWSEDFHHALHAALTGERNGYYADFGGLADIAKALNHGYVYDGRHSVFRNRRHGRSAQGVPRQRFVGCLQNHDQIGNRALGERIGHLLSPGRLKVGAALTLTAPFVPMLFQGEEWNASAPFLYFTDHQDPALGAAVREGRRHEFAAFGWSPESVPDPQAPETFRRSVLDWDERSRAGHAEILDFHRALLRLRRSRPELAAGTAVDATCDERAGWLRVARGATTVAANLGSVSRNVPLARAGGTILLASDPGARLARGAVRLPPDSVAIVGRPARRRAARRR